MGKSLQREEEDFVKVLELLPEEIGGGGRGGGMRGSGGCHRGVPDGQAVSSQGVIVGGGGGKEGRWRTTWGCQGAWQVETRRPVTGGEHGSVREDGGGEGPR